MITTFKNANFFYYPKLSYIILSSMNGSSEDVNRFTLPKHAKELKINGNYPMIYNLNSK